MFFTIYTFIVLLCLFAYTSAIVAFWRIFAQIVFSCKFANCLPRFPIWKMHEILLSFRSRSKRYFVSLQSEKILAPNLSCDLWEYLWLVIFMICQKYSAVITKIKSSLCSWYYVEACSEWRGPSPRLSAWVTQLRRNIAAVASRWCHCFRFDGPVIEPSPPALLAVFITTTLD